MPNQGEVYLAPFPFSDEHTEKKRPVLVISNSVFNLQSTDVLVMAMTSNLDDTLPGLEIDPAEVEAVLLPKRTRVLPYKVYSVAQERLEKRFCRVRTSDLTKVLAMLDEILH